MARGLGCRFYQVNITVEGWCDYKSVTASIVWKKFCLAQQQRPESPTVTRTWHASKYKVHKLCLLVEFMYLVFTRMPGKSHHRWPLVEFMYLVFTPMPGESYHRWPLVEFMYLVFTPMPGESYHKQLGSLLLCLCDFFEHWLTPLCVDLHECSGLVLF